MNDFFSSRMVAGALGVLLAVLILALFGWLKFKWDEKIVARFLKDSGIETGDTARTTNEISRATSLSEVRIRKICSRSSLIARHGDDRESWKLP